MVDNEALAVDGVTEEVTRTVEGCDRNHSILVRRSRFYDAKGTDEGGAEITASRCGSACPPFAQTEIRIALFRKERREWKGFRVIHSEGLQENKAICLGTEANETSQWRACSGFTRDSVTLSARTNSASPPSQLPLYLAKANSEKQQWFPEPKPLQVYSPFDMRKHMDQPSAFGGGTVEREETRSLTLEGGDGGGAVHTMAPQGDPMHLGGGKHGDGVQTIHVHIGMLLSYVSTVQHKEGERQMHLESAAFSNILSCQPNMQPLSLCSLCST
jgi:hypothetical protein